MTPVSQTPYLRHRGTFTAHTPDHPETVTAALACCRAVIEAMMYPKRPSTRRDTPYTRAPENNQTGVVNKPKVGLIYDIGVANMLFTTPRHVRGKHPGFARGCHGCLGMV